MVLYNIHASACSDRLLSLDFLRDSCARPKAWLTIGLRRENGPQGPQIGYNGQKASNKPVQACWCQLKCHLEWLIDLKSSRWSKLKPNQHDNRKPEQTKQDLQVKLTQLNWANTGKGSRWRVWQVIQRHPNIVHVLEGKRGCEMNKFKCVHLSTVTHLFFFIALGNTDKAFFYAVLHLSSSWRSNKLCIQQNVCTKAHHRLPPISYELCFRAGGKALITTRNWINIHWCSYTEWIPINPRQLIQFRNTQKCYLIQHKEMTEVCNISCNRRTARTHALTHRPHLKWEIRLSSNPVQHYGGIRPAFLRQISGYMQHTYRNRQITLWEGNNLIFTSN